MILPFELSGLLSLTDAMARGWSVTIDGNDAAFEKNALRAVQLPAGPHHVEMIYRTPGLIAGAVLFALALLFSFSRKGRPLVS